MSWIRLRRYVVPHIQKKEGLNHFIPHFTLQYDDFESTEEKIGKRVGERRTCLISLWPLCNRFKPTERSIIQVRIMRFYTGSCRFKCVLENDS